MSKNGLTEKVITSIIPLWYKIFLLGFCGRWIDDYEYGVKKYIRFWKMFLCVLLCYWNLIYICNVTMPLNTRLFWVILFVVQYSVKYAGEKTTNSSIWKYNYVQIYKKMLIVWGNIDDWWAWADFLTIFYRWERYV